ncbi:MAG: hypothetical protein UZ21_OP11001000659 [Microgenomates bacterium OLB22]|nr:MAG: hypothetical protein UZ21_OP11001000659 [Microgenomates bacterium OLB22]
MQWVAFVVQGANAGISLTGAVEDKFNVAVQPLLDPHRSTVEGVDDPSYIVDTSGKSIFVLVPVDGVPAFRLIVLGLGMQILFEYRMPDL